MDIYQSIQRKNCEYFVKYTLIRLWVLIAML